MSSLNSSFNAPIGPQATGLSMGQMGEGGGSNFYMSGGEEQHEEEQQGNQGHPDLVLIDQGKEDERNQNRQFLENLIVSGNSPNLFNPWGMAPKERSPEQVRRERESVRIISKSRGQDQGNRMFIINA